MDKKISFSQRAILLYGPRKAGTSLMHNLLDGGSELMMLPGELKLNDMTLMRRSLSPAEYSRAYLQKGRLDFPQLLKMDGESQQLSPRAEYSLEGLSQEQTAELLDIRHYINGLSEILQSRSENFHDIITRDVTAFAGALRGEARRDYSCWAAKDVGGRSTRVIQFFRETFPSGKIVFIARQPEFVVRSIILDRKRKGITLKWRDVWRECLKAQSLVNFLAQEKQRPRQTDTFVAYEKLTADTKSEMQRIARHLKIPFEPVLCEPTTLGVPVVVRTSSHKTTQVFRPEANWRKDLSPSQTRAIVGFFRLAPIIYKRKNQIFTPYSQLLEQL